MVGFTDIPGRCRGREIVVAAVRIKTGGRDPIVSGWIDDGTVLW